MVFGGAGNDNVLGGDGGTCSTAMPERQDLRRRRKRSDRCRNRQRHGLWRGWQRHLRRGQGDGNDTYYGDEWPAASAATRSTWRRSRPTSRSISERLMGRGSASSSQSGNDTLRGVENVVTGSGDDRITASERSQHHGWRARQRHLPLPVGCRCGRRHDLGFQPGDKIDLSAIDANNGSSQSHLHAGRRRRLRAAGALRSRTKPGRRGLHRSSRAASMEAGEAEFRLSIKGNHNLTDDDFNL